MSDILHLQNISVRFGGLNAVDDVTCAVQQGHIHGLIGPNGAGKTTLFNTISGLVPHQAGTMTLDGINFDASPIWQRTAIGLARTFQNIRLFADMSVIENVMAGAHSHITTSWLDILLRTAAWRRDEWDVYHHAQDWLNFVGLRHAMHQRAGDLSYGDQRRVEIARALMAQPKVLLLDEPAAGLNPAETQNLTELLKQLKARGLTIIIVEHDMPLVMAVCDRISVLNFGKLIAQGAPHEVRNHPQVVEAYLGAKIAHQLSHAATAVPPIQEGR